MVIETGRLRIVPLDADMLETLSRDVKEFEREYDAKYDGESINDELKSILGRCAEEVREDEDNKVFLTTWLIELKGEKAFIISRIQKFAGKALKKI